MNHNIELISNPFRNEDYTAQFESEECRRFHSSLPNYSHTPLIDLKQFSKTLNLKSLQIKDESKRFNLNAFKSLGASYAMAKIIVSSIGCDQSDLDYQLITQHKNAIKDMTFVTATDGNHGRAVAWSAEKYGCQARVYLPKGTSKHRIDAIESHGANAEVTEFNYDETVSYAATMAEENDWILIQDTAWVGYENIPKDIMIGYQTIIHELIHDEFIWPTHVVMQAGVGSFAASIFDAFCNISRPKPKFILVEPSGAACYFKSIKVGDGHPHPVKKLDTLMAGLSCGIPSILAWDIISQTADFFATCDDEVTLDAMRKLSQQKAGDHSIISGESGAVTTGFIEAICSSPKYSEFDDLIGINDSSSIFCISTEGDTNPDLYNKTVSGQ